jgi:glutaredoxin
MIRNLTEGECRFAMEKGDFESSLIQGKTAVILTQSWCPQWKALKSCLKEAEKRSAERGFDITILYVEYDLVSWYEEFMYFKEKTFNNREIPYIRYYSGGICTGSGNYTDLRGFLHRLGTE